jgi:hypothetical protein
VQTNAHFWRGTLNLFFGTSIKYGMLPQYHQRESWRGQPRKPTGHTGLSNHDKNDQPFSSRPARSPAKNYARLSWREHTYLLRPNSGIDWADVNIPAPAKNSWREYMLWKWPSCILETRSPARNYPRSSWNEHTCSLFLFHNVGHRRLTGHEPYVNRNTDPQFAGSCCRPDMGRQYSSMRFEMSY